MQALNYGQGILKTPAAQHLTRATLNLPLLHQAATFMDDDRLSDTEKMQADQFGAGDINFSDTESYIGPEMIPGNQPLGFVDGSRDFSQFNQARMGFNQPMGTDTIAEELIDENRIPGRIQESVPNSQNWFERMMSGAKDKFSNFKMPPLGIMGLMNAIGNQFEDRQLTGDIMDESGNMYSAEALNKQNALGGYYTDPARSARRRTNRIRNMLNRQKAGKTISTKNLQTLQAQVADQANIQKIQQHTGQPVSDYRMSRPASERQYTGPTSRSGAFSSKSGMGRRDYADGGLATLFARRG